MALIHRAQIRPTKLELLAAWLPTQHWFRGDAGGVERVSGFRFDDPAGEVGIETLLVRSGDGPVHQVPLTYRGAPLTGGDDHLVGTTEHSALGSRWVYDACGDPVYASALASTIVTAGGEAEEYFEDGERRPPSMTVAGSGSAGAAVPTVIRQVVDGDLTRIVTDTVELTIVRRVGGGESPHPKLTGTWDGEPHLLAYAEFSD
jgi:hypothetical protein